MSRCSSAARPMGSSESRRNTPCSVFVFSLPAAVRGKRRASQPVPSETKDGPPAGSSAWCYTFAQQRPSYLHDNIVSLRWSRSSTQYSRGCIINLHHRVVNEEINNISILIYLMARHSFELVYKTVHYSHGLSGCRILHYSFR